MTINLTDNQRNALAAMDIHVWLQREVGETGTNEILPDAHSSAAEDTVALPDWETLESQVQQCTQCELSDGRTQAVFGVGNRQADWLFVGEAPGAEEDKQGEPFVGRAGQLLNAMLSAIGLQRQQIYIANVLKCRPPLNRDPHMDEVIQCEPYLLRQIELIQPRVIVALGRFAAHSLLRTDLAVGRLRNQKHDYHGCPLVVTYHPAYLLRNPADKKKVWQDLCLARSVVMPGDDS